VAFEQVGNDNWGKSPYTNTFFLERYMLHTDWHLGEHVRAFVQLKSGLESFRLGGPRPIDEKKLDFEAAFVEVGTISGENWLVLQAGRQELNYGSGRLVSVREGYPLHLASELLVSNPALELRWSKAVGKSW
jgi:hypothetical protein